MMSQTTLEQRVTILEEQVRALLANQAAAAPKNLRGISGAFTGDDVMKQIFDEGRKIREAERRRARRPAAKKRKARS
ncbi:MAG TPA: hypothetical protein PK867_17570 [Pirellulales bacterium]|nr:hypothetical protein [Pirellulales bacterium]